MFQNIAVKNFRCFTGLLLQPLARINLIAGMNNTGKTALLEAIHLHNNPGNPPEVAHINLLRGIAEPMQDIQGIEDVIGWLFHDRQSTGGMEVSSDDEKGQTRTLSVWVLDPATLRERFPDAEAMLQNGIYAKFSNQPRLVLRYQEHGSPDRFAVAVLGPNTGLSWSGMPLPWSIPSVYLSSGVRASDQDLKFFGELEGSKRVDEILPALRIVEPRLVRLAPLPLAGTWTIHGDIGLSRLVPIPFMGEGTRRLLSLVLAIFNASGGVVLIDEIENGLHYSVMKKVWQAVAEAARKADVQVFATTHSYECICAAHEAFADHGPYDFRLHRLDRTGDGIGVATYGQETLETALELAHEVR